MRAIIYLLLLLPLTAHSADTQKLGFGIFHTCRDSGCKVTCLIEPVGTRNDLALKSNVFKGVKSVSEVYYQGGARVLFLAFPNDRRERLMLSDTMYCHIANIRKSEVR